MHPKYAEAVVYDTQKRQKPGRPARQLTDFEAREVRVCIFEIRTILEICVYSSVEVD